MSVSKGGQLAIPKVGDIDEAEQVRAGMFEALELIRDQVQIPAGGRVLIKVNLCLLLGSETGATVDPYLVKYLVEWLFEREQVEEVVIAEADATSLSADVAFKIL